MKKLLLALLVVAFAAPLAAAEAPPAVASEPSSSVLPAALDTAPGLDIDALSPEDFLALLKATGLGMVQPAPAAPPPCPVAVACTSPLGLCGISLHCTFTNLGPCCTTAGGLQRCCISGNIIVQSCPCVGPGCPSAQVSSSCM